MQVTSSYGAEIKKQNLPVRHTLRIYRAAVEYLIRVYAERWDELQQIDPPKSGLTQQNIWCMRRKRTGQSMSLICIFRKCLPI